MGSQRNVGATCPLSSLSLSRPRPKKKKKKTQLRHPRPGHRPLQRARPPAAQQRLRDRVRVADAHENQALCPALRRRDVVCLPPKANPKLDGRGAQPLRYLWLGALCQQGRRRPRRPPRPRRARAAAKSGRAVERQGKKKKKKKKKGGWRGKKQKRASRASSSPLTSFRFL